MNPFEMAERLRSLYGFVDGYQEKDLGFHREWLIYLTRRTKKDQYQHLWLTTYDDRFVESILYVYSKPFNPRARPAQATLHCAIYRSMDEIVKAVEKTYGENPERQNVVKIS